MLNKDSKLMEMKNGNGNGKIGAANMSVGGTWTSFNQLC